MLHLLSHSAWLRPLLILNAVLVLDKFDCISFVNKPCLLIQLLGPSVARGARRSRRHEVLISESAVWHGHFRPSQTWSAWHVLIDWWAEAASRCWPCLKDILVIPCVLQSLIKRFLLNTIGLSLLRRGKLHELVSVAWRHPRRRNSLKRPELIRADSMQGLNTVDTPFRRQSPLWINLGLVQCAW